MTGQRVFRVSLHGSNPRRLVDAANARGMVPEYLLDLLVNLVLHEDLIDAVMDDGNKPTADTGAPRLGTRHTFRGG